MNYIIIVFKYNILNILKKTRNFTVFSNELKRF